MSPEKRRSQWASETGGRWNQRRRKRKYIHRELRWEQRFSCSRRWLTLYLWKGQQLNRFSPSPWSIPRWTLRMCWTWPWSPILPQWWHRSTESKPVPPDWKTWACENCWSVIEIRSTWIGSVQLWPTCTSRRRRWRREWQWIRWTCSACRELILKAQLWWLICGKLPRRADFRLEFQVRRSSRASFERKCETSWLLGEAERRVSPQRWSRRGA